MKGLRWKIVALTLLSIGVCIVIGFAADHVFNTKPIGLISSIVVSVFVAQIVVWKFVRRYLKDNPVSLENEEKPE